MADGLEPIDWQYEEDKEKAAIWKAVTLSDAEKEIQIRAIEKEYAERKAARIKEEDQRDRSDRLSEDISRIKTDNARIIAKAEREQQEAFERERREEYDQSIQREYSTYKDSRPTESTGSPSIARIARNRSEIARADEADNEPDLPGSFVYLSYSAANRRFVAGIHALLGQVGISTWWDQDLDAGSIWRDALKNRLDEAAAVVTFWTKTSIDSSSVREEADRALKAGKWIPVRLDDAPMPFGYEEIHWIDLQRWDGTESDPNFLKLVQTLQDKLDPPSKGELRARQLASSPVAAKYKSGKIALYDTPVNTEARVQNKEDLEARLKGLWSSIDRVEREIADPRVYQLPEEARRRLFALSAVQGDDPLTWYALKDAADALAECMQRFFAEDSWNEGVYSDFKGILKRVNELQDLLQPEQPLADSPSAKPPESEPIVRREQVSEAKEIAESVLSELGTKDANAALDPTTIAMISRVSEAMAEATTDLLAPEEGGSLYERIRSGVKGLVYTLGAVVIAVTGGVIVNLLTAPEAAVMLANRLQSILDKLLRFYM